MKRFFGILLALLMLCAFIPSISVAEPSTVTIKVLLTSDVHGALFGSNYSTGAADTGLTRVAAKVAEIRAANDNVILIDDGDLIQGTPLTYYYAFYKPEVEDPAVKTLRTMGYDAWVLGNHEFNYGLDILNRQVAQATAASTADESQVAVLAANFVKTDSTTYEPYFGNYIVREFDGIRVGIIGLNTPNIPTWDKPANWEGIEFKSFINTWNHYADILKNDEGCDIVVAACHSGIESATTLVEADGTITAGEGLYYEGSWESQIRALISQTEGIDLVLGGHAHSTNVTTINNKNGDPVTVLQSGTKAKQLGEATLEYNTETNEVTVSAQNIAVAKTEAKDATLTAALQPYETEVWDSYLNQVLGTATAAFASPGNMTEPNAFLDLVNRVQLAATGAQMSLSAPLNNNSGDVIAAGQITLGNTFQLYIYENWLYNIDMTGAEIKEWLEYAATKYTGKADGSISGGGIYCDTLYGPGVYYEVHVDEPVGSRIYDLQYNGAPIGMDTTYQVAINNYRFTGGGHYIENVSTMQPSDESRVNYSTQYDMEQGEDKGQVRNLLAEYIRTQGTISPVIESNFKVVRSMTFAYYETTDMHGRSTELDVSTNANDGNSMVRTASVLTADRAQYGANTITVDNGDTYQGNLLAQYAATIKNTEENPMTTALKYMGYDAFVLGNHEFNYLPTVRDTQMKLLEDAGIDVLAANVTLVAEGTNLAGETVAAGSTFYDPYTIKEFTSASGNKVRVAVIGFENAACDTWDSSQNFPNLQFHSADNATRAFQNEINKWVAYVNANEDVDIIIVSAHTGTGVNSEASTSLESQGLFGAARASGVALYSFGHDHSPVLTTVVDAAGKTIPVINGGCSTIAKAEFAVTFDAEGNVADYTVTTSALKISDGAVDTTLQSALQTWFDNARAWAAQSVGTFSGGWSNEAIQAQATGKSDVDMVMSETYLLNLIHKAQIWATWQSYESKGIAGATVSIASPVFGKVNGKLSYVPQDGDTVSLLDVSRLYRYSNNLLVACDFTGEQLWNWMNTVADMYDYNAETGKISLNTSIYGVDTFYGVDYTIDLTKAKGERLVKAQYMGEDLKTYAGIIRVAMNSYRIGGGYGFVEATGLTGDDCCWTASSFLGDQHAPVPTLICEYIQAKGTVTPYDKPLAGVDSYWTLLTAGALDYTSLQSAITYAQDVLGSDQSANFSAGLREKWNLALEAALAELANANATQDTIDAATQAIRILAKTGEAQSYVVVFAGIAVLAILGLALVLRRRYN